MVTARYFIRNEYIARPATYTGYEGWRRVRVCGRCNDTITLRSLSSGTLVKKWNAASCDDCRSGFVKRSKRSA